MLQKALWVTLALSLAPLGARADLTSVLIEELQAPSAARRESVTTALTGYHVVFAQLEDQFRSGLRAFDDHIRTLQEELHTDAPTLLTVSLYTSYEANSARLHAELLDAYKRNGKRPLILVGNPGTGPEFLYTTLKYPDLVRDAIVARILLIMPVFGLPILVDREALVARHENCSPVFDFVCREINKVLNGKISKLDPQGSRKAFEQRIKSAGKQAEKISRMVYYVRGGVLAPLYTPPGLHEVDAIARKLLPYYALSARPGRRTDALTYVEDQYLAGFGTDLTSSGPLNVSHWDLFASNEVHTPARLRDAFTRAVFAEMLGIH